LSKDMESCIMYSVQLHFYFSIKFILDLSKKVYILIDKNERGKLWKKYLLILKIATELKN